MGQQDFTMRMTIHIDIVRVDQAINEFDRSAFRKAKGDPTFFAKAKVQACIIDFCAA